MVFFSVVSEFYKRIQGNVNKIYPRDSGSNGGRPQGGDDLGPEPSEKYIYQHQLEVEKRWSELLSIMTEDDTGHVRATEETALMKLWIEEFFIKLAVYRERLDKRVTEIKNRSKE